MTERSEFLHPRSRYYGKFTPEYLVFDANLQEFAQRVNYICSLETSGKITPVEAYQQIQTLWQQLEESKHQLNIDRPPEDPETNQPQD